MNDELQVRCPLFDNCPVDNTVNSTTACEHAQPHIRTGLCDLECTKDGKTVSVASCVPFTRLAPQGDVNGLAELPVSRDEGDVEAEWLIKGFNEGRKAQKALDDDKFVKRLAAHGDICFITGKMAMWNEVYEAIPVGRDITGFEILSAIGKVCPKVKRVGEQ